MQKIISCLILLIVTVSCKTNVINRSNEIRISKSVKLTLCHPSTFKNTITVQQQLSGRYNNENYSMQSVVSIDKNELKMVCLSHSGQSLFSLIFDGQRLRGERTPLISKKFKAEYMLMDFQFCYWPIEELKNAFGRTLSINEIFTEDKKAKVREIRHKNRLIIQIHYSEVNPWSALVLYSNKLHGYRFKIRSKEIEN
jgi:hypothetical protein